MLSFKKHCTMIKFLRRIRQNLLSENKFSKYLIYAIGEIILVVIGILIALQINNRNEYKKAYESASNDLKQIQYELSQDINSYNADISYNNWAIKYFNHIKLKEFDSINAKKIFGIVSGHIGNLDVSKSYDKLNNAGNMDIIKNSSLVNALHDYYLEERKKYNNFANFNIEFTSNNIEGYLLYKLPLDENLNTTKVAILDEMENGNLKNLMNYQSRLFNRSTIHSKELIEKAKTIIKLIEKELNK